MYIYSRMTDLDESEVGHERFDLFDDFRLGAHIERFKLHGKDRLFFRLRGNFFFARSYIVCSCSGGWKCGACRGEGYFLDVQTRLYVYMLLLEEGKKNENIWV